MLCVHELWIFVREIGDGAVSQFIQVMCDAWTNAGKNLKIFQGPFFLI
jgi:hypothetical protein